MRDVTRNIGRRHRLKVLSIGALIAVIACGKSDPKTPAIEGMGAPGVAWSIKSEEQKFGYMAAVVHPEMQAVFASYDDGYATDFTCATCHGDDAELVDYKMPSEVLYRLPKDNTIEAAMEYDEEVTNAMMAKVTPAMKKLLERGDGPKTKVTCLSCHMAE